MADDLKLKLQIDSTLNPVGIEQAKAEIAGLGATAAAATPPVEALGVATSSLAGPLTAVIAAVGILLPSLITWARRNYDVEESADKLNTNLGVTLRQLEELTAKLPGAIKELDDLHRAMRGDQAKAWVDQLKAIAVRLAEVRAELTEAQTVVKRYEEAVANGFTATYKKADEAKIAIERLGEEHDSLTAKARYLEDAILNGSTAADRAAIAVRALAEADRETGKAAANLARDQERLAKQRLAHEKRARDFADNQNIDAQIDMAKMTRIQRDELKKRLLAEADYNRKKLAYNKAEAENDKQVALNKKMLAIDAVGYVGQSLSAMSTLFGGNKAIAIAGAIADTYAAATRALAIYGPTPVGYIAMAAAIVTGMANVKVIREAEPVGFDDPFADMTARRLGRKSAVDFVRNFGGAFSPGVQAGMGAMGGASNTTINRGTTINMGGIHGALGPRPAFDKWLERAMTKATRNRGRTTVGR